MSRASILFRWASQGPGLGVRAATNRRRIVHSRDCGKPMIGPPLARRTSTLRSPQRRATRSAGGAWSPEPVATFRSRGRAGLSAGDAEDTVGPKDGQHVVSECGHGWPNVTSRCGHGGGLSCRNGHPSSLPMRQGRGRRKGHRRRRRVGAGASHADQRRCGDERVRHRRSPIAASMKRSRRKTMPVRSDAG